MKFVYRHFAAIGEESVWAAEATECAGEQGKFWEYLHQLFQQPGGRAQGTYQRDNLKRYAGEIGLDRAAFDTCLTSERYAAQVRAEMREGRSKGVDATPTVFVNGRKLQGGATLERIAQAVEAAQPSR